jgi:hypothetical protein
MEEKTKKKRVQKRAVRKKTKATEPVAAAVSVAVTTETKKPRKSSKAKSKSKPRKPTTNVPTFEQVQLRAYFVSERRRKLGLPGDDSHDWLIAERELREELSV